MSLAELPADLVAAEPGQTDLEHDGGDVAGSGAFEGFLAGLGLLDREASNAEGVSGKAAKRGVGVDEENRCRAWGRRGGACHRLLLPHGQLRLITSLGDPPEEIGRIPTGGRTRTAIASGAERLKLEGGNR